MAINQLRKHAKKFQESFDETNELPAIDRVTLMVREFQGELNKYAPGRYTLTAQTRFPGFVIDLKIKDSQHRNIDSHVFDLADLVGTL